MGKVIGLDGEPVETEEAEENVIELDIDRHGILDAKEVLSGAMQANLRRVLVLGVTEDNDTYICDTDDRAEETLRLMGDFDFAIRFARQMARHEQ